MKRSAYIITCSFLFLTCGFMQSFAYMWSRLNHGANQVEMSVAVWLGMNRISQKTTHCFQIAPNRS